MIPRGAAREKLRKDGRIKDVPFLRYFTFDEVKTLIKESFSLSCEFKFLRSQKDNTLCIAPKQELDGSEVIDLAGHGSIYLEQFSMSPPRSLPQSPPRSPLPDSKLDISPREVDCEGKACHDREASCERECLIKKADSVLEKLRVSFVLLFQCTVNLHYCDNRHFYCLTDIQWQIVFDSDVEFTEEVIIEVKLAFVLLYNNSCMHEYQGSKDNLEENRMLRREQDLEYLESLRVDTAKASLASDYFVNFHTHGGLFMSCICGCEL